MKVVYDPARDLMYMWLGKPGGKSARTETVSPGVHADFDRENRLIGIEILDASEVINERFQFEVSITNPASMSA